MVDDHSVFCFLFLAVAPLLDAFDKFKRPKLLPVPAAAQLVPNIRSEDHAPPRQPVEMVAMAVGASRDTHAGDERKSLPLSSSGAHIQKLAAAPNLSMFMFQGRKR
jgi:hypothetical protein